MTFVLNKLYWQVSAGLTEAQAKLAAAADDRARAEAQISVGTYMAMQAAVSGN